MYHAGDRAIVPASYRNSRSLPESYSLVHQSKPRTGVRYGSGGTIYHNQQPGATMYHRQTMYQRQPVVYHQNGRTTRYYGNQNTMYHNNQVGRYNGQGTLYHRNSRVYQSPMDLDPYTGRNSYHEQRYVVPVNNQARYIRGYDPQARQSRRYGYRDTYHREVVEPSCCVIA
ncbi:hypothetical protein B9Z19DRAFT_1072670 [Tuber borchii]|uniref:Uncharacterized protein n=1 Tax=Tuber borchii TaxID=42251 RepID=A0A2T7A6T2_TUBBO|nr:hypothetical protein B9Z19DRAFT_1072670 [Tuber borchii]